MYQLHRVNKLTNFMSSIIYSASSLSTASTGGCARPAKQVGVVRDVQGRSVENNDIILFPNKVISSHDGLVSSPHTGLKKIQPGILNFFLDTPLEVPCCCDHLLDERCLCHLRRHLLASTLTNFRGATMLTSKKFNSEVPSHWSGLSANDAV